MLRWPLLAAGLLCALCQAQRASDLSNVQSRPVVIRLPSAATPRPPPQTRAPQPPQPLTPKAVPLPVPTAAPPTDAAPAAAPAPPSPPKKVRTKPQFQIPPQLSQLLGLQNLGIPGLGAGGRGALPPGFNLPNLANLGLGSNTFAGLNPALSGIQAGLPTLGSQPSLGSLGQPNQGLLAPTFGSIPNLNGGQNVPLPASQAQNGGFLNILTALAKQLTQASGIQGLLRRGQATAADAAGGQAVGPQLSPNLPPVAGIPRIPGIPLLPGGIPRNGQGQVDIVRLISSVTRRASNGTTLADVLPADRLQLFADNVTNVLLPKTPDVDLSKMMGRWFEGINSPRATDQRCIVHHYGGLTDNDATATFTALKIYREGSEFGQVRYAIGYSFRGGHRSAMLQMHSSESVDAQPYWVYMVGPEGEDPFGNPQYEYVVVSNWVKYPLTVLVRDPDTFKAKYEEDVLRYLEDKGFINGFIRAFNLLQPVSYENCQYAPSTFEVFGR